MINNNKYYNADFICTYKMMDNDDDRNLLYQIQILQAFGLNCFGEDKLNKKIILLNEQIKECSQIKEIIQECLKANQDKGMCEIMAFICLFSYHFFDLFHTCLIDFFTHGSILEETKNKLIDKIKCE